MTAYGHPMGNAVEGHCGRIDADVVQHHPVSSLPRPAHIAKHRVTRQRRFLVEAAPAREALFYEADRLTPGTQLIGAGGRITALGHDDLVGVHTRHGARHVLRAPKTRAIERRFPRPVHAGEDHVHGLHQNTPSFTSSRWRCCRKKSNTAI